MVQIRRMRARVMYCKDVCDMRRSEKKNRRKIENHFHIETFNGVITIGPSSGNTINYGPEVRLKLDGPPELYHQICGTINDRREIVSIPINELEQFCDGNVIYFRKGCVELTLRVGSPKGLEKLLAMCNSGDLKQLLGREFPVNSLRVVEEDIVQARKFFEEEKAKMKNELRKKVQEFEDAAGEYVRCRVKMIELLKDLVELCTRRQRQAAAVGGVGAGLALLTFGASSLLSAAAASAAVGIVAGIVQAVTAKISTDEAKMIMAKDKVACDRVQETLEKVDLKLREWEGKEEGVLIGSIHDLVRVDEVNLKRGVDAIEKIKGEGRGEFVQFVVLTVDLDRIIVYIQDMFPGDVSRLAKEIQEIADKLDCPNETSMRERVSKMKTRFQLDNN
ncbi:uncharacterized protein LOC119725104 [Patiria miniata]|uniref:Uncharacterized protein n=1 Tax=Patiria miniata TaxID=46514 RepID=A0A913ZKV1_PATMI|nr:uncharacterized protein LOC119725104 [Patiria miniata]